VVYRLLLTDCSGNDGVVNVQGESLFELSLLDPRPHWFLRSIGLLTDIGPQPILIRVTTKQRGNDMSEYTPGIEAELHVSPVPVLVVMPTLAAVLFVGVQVLSCPWEVVRQTMSLLQLTGGLAVAGYLLNRMNPQLGRWFTVLAGLAVIHLLSIWLTIPAALVLISVPIALAVQLVGPRAAFVIGLGESLLMAILTSIPKTPPDVPTAAVAMLGIWSMLAAVYAYYRPVRRLSDWLDEYLNYAHQFMEETRDRKMDLEQALESLAHANRQLGLANERAATLRRIAEEAQRTKTAFVANVSHEFRTPLNMIIGLVDLMVETPEIYAVALSPKMKEDLEVVHRNCEHLSNMINDVLDLTRIDSGRFALHKERVNLGNLVERVVQAVAPLVDKKALQLQDFLPRDLPDVYCDRVRVQQVILNLVSNAARFTERGSIQIGAVQENQHVTVSVADTGPGIAPQDAERIFEPFDQGSCGESREFKGGSGLGLSISEQFIKLHGGRMWLESRQGAGTTFFFTLPVSPAIDHVARPGHQIRGDWVWRERLFQSGRICSDEYRERPRVIVCDQDKTLSNSLSHFTQDVEIVAVSNVDQAVQELEQCPAHVVMLNQAQAPALSLLLEEARQKVSGTPIVGCSIPLPLERATSAGAMGHLVKPVTRADLVEALNAVGNPVRCALVVDDDPEVRQLLSRMLLACDGDLDVVMACTGVEAIERLGQMPIDVMFLDIMMPDMDGWQVLRVMKEDAALRQVPVFFVSAQDPSNQPVASDVMAVAMDKGIAPSCLLRCSLAVSRILFEPGGVLGPEPGGMHAV